MERVTRQRSAIRAVVESADRPLSPAELYQAARTRLPRIGIATVYRAIRDLLQSGWLRAVEIPGLPARYERAGKPHHHHFLCRICNSLWEVTGCRREVDALAPAGFVTEGHDVTLYGLCSDCRSANAG
jgi:Fur family ferric uptake transcriptional regulator